MTAGAAAAQAGPPAWNEEWRQKFLQAGVPSELVQQLTFTGAMGADEAQLQQMFTELNAEIEQTLAAFKASHPEEYAKVEKQAGRPELVQVAMAVNSGQVSDKQLAELVEQIGMTPGSMMKKMILTEMLPWTFIPGWGALRMVLSPFFGGKDPISKREIRLDFWNQGTEGYMNALFAVGGALSLAHTARGAMTVHQGLKLAGSGGVAGQIAAQQGVSNLTGWNRAMAYLPGTHANRTVTGVARLNADLMNGIAKLQPGANGAMGTQDYANLVLQKWQAGEIEVVSKSGLGQLPFGMKNEVRGVAPVIGNRNKPMFEWIAKDGQTILKLDGRLHGESLAAHFAAAGVSLAPSGATQATGSQLLAAAPRMGRTPVDAMQRLVLGQAAAEMGLQYTGLHAGPLGRFMSTVAPGPLDDAIRAMNNPTNQLSASGQLFANPWARRGLMASGAVGGGYLLHRHQSKAAEQAQQGAAGQVPAGRAPAAGAVAGAVLSSPATAPIAAGAASHLGGGPALTPELQQAAQTLAGMPAADQEAFVTEQLTALQAAAAKPGITPEEQAAIGQRVAELELLVGTAQGMGASQPGAVPAGA